MPSSPRPWIGRAWLGDGWGSFDGDVGDHHAHAHHALQLLIGHATCVRAQIDVVAVTGEGLLIAADVPHALDPGRARLLYIERESSAGRRLTASLPQGFRTLDRPTCTALVASWPGPGLASALQPVLDLLLGCVADAASEKPDARTDRVQQVIASPAGRAAEPLTLVTLAREAALSPSRFGHRVKALTGMPLRPYLRWLRLARALAQAADGQTLTQAAYSTGFSDAAHLTRTMQRHFGIPPQRIVDSLRQECCRPVRASTAGHPRRTLRLPLLESHHADRSDSLRGVPGDPRRGRVCGAGRGRRRRSRRLVVRAHRSGRHCGRRVARARAARTPGLAGRSR